MPNHTTEILFLIKPQNHSKYSCYIYGVVLIKVRNMCCNLRLIILIIEINASEDFWLFDLDINFVYTFVQVNSTIKLYQIEHAVNDALLFQ